MAGFHSGAWGYKRTCHPVRRFQGSCVARTTTVAAGERSARRKAELSLSVSHHSVPAHDAAALQLRVAAAGTSESSFASMSTQRVGPLNRLPTCQMTSRTPVDLRRVELFRKAAKMDLLTAGAKVQRAFGVSTYCGLDARPRKPPGLNSRGRRSRIPRIARQTGSSCASLLGAAHTTSFNELHHSHFCAGLEKVFVTSYIASHRCAGQMLADMCEEQERCVWVVESRQIVPLFFGAFPRPGAFTLLHSKCLEILRSRLSSPVWEHVACLRKVELRDFFFRLFGYYKVSLRYVRDTAECKACKPSLSRVSCREIGN
jgi:hypothetical protein